MGRNFEQTIKFCSIDKSMWEGERPYPIFSWLVRVLHDSRPSERLLGCLINLWLNQIKFWLSLSVEIDWSESKLDWTGIIMEGFYYLWIIGIVIFCNSCLPALHSFLLQFQKKMWPHFRGMPLSRTTKQSFWMATLRTTMVNRAMPTTPSLKTTVSASKWSWTSRISLTASGCSSGTETTAHTPTLSRYR